MGLRTTRLKVSLTTHTSLLIKRLFRVPLTDVSTESPEICYNIDQVTGEFNCIRPLLDMIKNLNYGIIGNCRSSALVSDQGSIDWCCLPDPDSPAIFARILDFDRGGHFSIHTQTEYAITQKYEGNFPQGYSHPGLIQSALILNGVNPEIEESQFTFIKP
jgi:Domain of unknown function (DUF5911)